MKIEVFEDTFKNRTVFVVSNDENNALKWQGFLSDKDIVNIRLNFALAQNLNDLGSIFCCDGIVVPVFLTKEEYLHEKDRVLWTANSTAPALELPSPFSNTVIGIHGDIPVPTDKKEKLSELADKIIHAYSVQDNARCAELITEINRYTEANGFRLLFLSKETFDKYQEQFIKNANYIRKTKALKFGVEDPDNILFFVLDKKEKIICLLAKTAFQFFKCLEDAVMSYRQTEALLLEYGHDGNCFRFDENADLKSISFASCRVTLQDTFLKEWDKTLSAVLKEKGNITKEDYIQNYWIKDISMGITHPKL